MKLDLSNHQRFINPKNDKEQETFLLSSEDPDALTYNNDTRKNGEQMKSLIVVN